MFKCVIFFRHGGTGLGLCIVRTLVSSVSQVYRIVMLVKENLLLVESPFLHLNNCTGGDRLTRWVEKSRL